MGKRPHRWGPLKEVVVFIEGGGPGRSRAELRKGLHEGLFLSLRDQAKRNGIRLRFEPGKGRDDTIERYRIAVQNDPFVSLLLVDAEGPVTKEPWDHLRHQGSGRELKADSEIHLMVQAIEAWFLADPEALKRYFGAKAHVKEFESKVDVELIPKQSLKGAMDTISKSARRVGYDEAIDQGPLLREVSATEIRSKSWHFARLWDALSKHVGA